MICPFRKQTKTVDDTTSEYYMECYKEECPFYDYHSKTLYNDNEWAECRRAEGIFWEVTHPIKSNEVKKNE